MGLYPRRDDTPAYGQTEVNGLTLPLGMVKRFRVAPDAVDDDVIHAAITLTEAPQTLTAEITQPDVPRNITATCATVGEVGEVVIAGTDYNGAALTETLTLNGAATVSGTKAFRTVTSIGVAALTGDPATVKIGQGLVYGLPDKLSNDAYALRVLFDGTAEADPAAAVAVSASVLASNTVTKAGANGTKVLEVVYIDFGTA